MSDEAPDLFAVEAGHAPPPACLPCAAAVTNPYIGESVVGCYGCAIRWTSQQPRARRELVLDAITDPGARRRFHEDCVAEYHRREALKVDRPLQ